MRYTLVYNPREELSREVIDSLETRGHSCSAIPTSGTSKLWLRDEGRIAFQWTGPTNIREYIERLD